MSTLRFCFIQLDSARCCEFHLRSLVLAQWLIAYSFLVTSLWSSEALAKQCGYHNPSRFALPFLPQFSQEEVTCLAESTLSLVHVLPASLGTSLWPGPPA